jgi:glycine cleavage system protein P-like pyridoxal-binding family
VKFLPLSDADRAEMLRAIGAPSVEVLFAAIPPEERLMDFGSHPPAISFPLIVHGALMIEPTETKRKPELDAPIDMMRRIVREAAEDPEIILKAPHTTPVKRVDEVAAARNLVLRWRPQEVIRDA